MPPSLFVSNTDSLAEQIQRAFPQVREVKALNTMNNYVMLHPQRLADGDHTVFVCGDDAGAKEQVTHLLVDGFGWRDVIDLGDLSAARGTEMIMPIWLRLWGTLQTGQFNFKVVR
jgi:predicted dinucleotide-binding enzyme